jgi:hypothetical protein
VNTKPRRQPASGAFSLTHTTTSNDAYMLTPNVAQHPAWLAEVMIWVTGESELATVRLSDDRIVNKHYDLADHGDLEVLLDELVGLLVDDRIPGAAVVAQWPGTVA